LCRTHFKTQAILQHRSKNNLLSAAPHTLAREGLARLSTFARVRAVNGIRVIFDETRASVTSQVWVNHVISNARQPLPLFTQQPTFFCVALTDATGQKETFRSTAQKSVLFPSRSSDVPFWLLKISQNVRSFFARICEPSHKHTSRTGLRSRNGPEEDMEDRVAIFRAAVEI
jgi:hypothetical protein